MTTRLPLAELIGRSAALDSLRMQMRRLAQISERGRLPSVLLLGETGTGKGLVAGLLHRTGRRAAGPFIDINCAAIPETLLEAELFGFERGAFTDARVAKQGLIEAAHQGTLFLDEIGELPDALQVKLLTAIESRQVRRLGSTRSEAVDMWIIAATSLDLSAAMRAGRFRRELYHRLSTVVLVLPPLRAREGDVVELAERFLARAALEHGVPAKRLDEAAYAALRAYPWPGNIRELGNVLERVTLLEDSPIITAAMLALEGRAGGRERRTSLESPRSAEVLRAEERQRLVEALDRSRGNITRAAAHLGIHRNTLRYRLAKHELTPRAAASDGEGVQPVTSGAVTSSPAAPAAKVIRWEERLVAVLGVSIVAAVAGTTFELAAMIADLIQLATSFGARIEQFSPSELVAVFGIDPMEDAARRAVLVAQAMLQALLRSDDKRHGRFAVHVGSYLIARAGIVTGLDAHAHRQAADAVSDLLKRTRPDEILVDPAAARLLERHFALEAADDSRGGLARVAGRQRRGFEVGGRTLSPFVGRAGDLDSIHALMTRAENGEAQILGLVGEPGVGKSRLLFELIHSRRVEGWLILETRSSSYGAATRDLPVVDLARSYFRISDRDTARDIREKVTGRLLTLDRALEPALPALFALLELTVDDPAWQSLDPSQRRRRTLDAVKRLLEREARIRPLLIVFEDLHWVDPETQAFLDTLVDSVATARLLLVASYRPEYRHTWADKPNYTQLRLDPLPPESADALLGAVLGRDASLDPLKQLLVARTGRNPLFIEESVQTLVETRGLAGDRGAYRLTQSVDAIQVPATVQAILAARIDRLPAEDKRLLEMAAVIGWAVPLPLLQAIAEGDDALAGRLGRLQAAEFLYETSAAPDVEYAFKHALTHEVAYGSVLGGRRRELHARISAAIERLHGDRLTEHLERLAHHTARGEVWDKALTYSQQAAEKAMARSAYREAVGHFEQAFNALRHQSPERDTQLAIDLRLGLRSALVPFGEHARILATLHEAEDLAEALGDHRRLGQVCVSLSYHCCANGAYDDAKAAARRALALATRDGEGALQALANQYVGLAHQAQGDFRRAIECFAQTAAFFDGSRRYERFGRVILPAVSVRADLAACHAELGTFAEGRAIAGDAVEIAEAVGHHTSLMMAYRALGLLLLRQGDVGALSLLERAVTICEDAELPVYFPWMAATLGAAYTLAGRADDAVPLLTRAMQQTTTTERDALSRLGLAEAQLLAGRLEKAAPLAERTLALATEHDERANQGYALRLLAEIAAQRQPPEWEEALARYRQALALSSDIGMRPLAAHCHLGLSRVYRRLDRSADAEMHRTTAITMYREMNMRLWLERSEER